MNARDRLSLNSDRGLPLALPRIAGAAISARLRYFPGQIISETPVTFLSWHTYPAIDTAINAELLRCSRDVGKQGNRIAAGEGVRNE